MAEDSTRQGHGDDWRSPNHGTQRLPNDDDDYCSLAPQQGFSPIIDTQLGYAAMTILFFENL